VRRAAAAQHALRRWSIRTACVLVIPRLFEKDKRKRPAAA